jgi:hypothetical protein
MIQPGELSLTGIISGRMSEESGGGAAPPQEGKVSIKIKINKIMVAGEERIEILGCQALPKKKLPEEYLTAAPHCYAVDDGHGLRWLRSSRMDLPAGSCLASWRDTVELLIVGHHYDPQEFARRVEFIRKCGERLQHINQEIKEETLVI